MRLSRPCSCIRSSGGETSLSSPLPPEHAVSAVVPVSRITPARRPCLTNWRRSPASGGSLRIDFIPLPPQTTYHIVAVIWLFAAPPHRRRGADCLLLRVQPFPRHIQIARTRPRCCLYCQHGYPPR